MAFPQDVGIVDTMIGFPHDDMKEVYAFITRQTKDAESKEEFEFPVEYMFKDVPEKELPGADRPDRRDARGDGPVGRREGADRGGRPDRARGDEALKRYPDRFIPSAVGRPQRRDGRHRRPWSATTRPGASGPSASSRPARSPRSPSTTRRCTRSTPSAWSSGSRSSAAPASPDPASSAPCQHVELIDEVMYDFPDLVFVTRHGCEPWTDLAIKLMLKWPGLHYSTSAFAPKYYPKDDHRLRQHPGRRQDHLRRLLPDGPLARADHDRDARRRLQGRRVAEVPAHQRAARAAWVSVSNVASHRDRRLTTNRREASR